MKEWIDQQFDSIELVEGAVFSNFEKADKVYQSCVEKIFQEVNGEEEKNLLNYTFRKYLELIKRIGTFEQYLEYDEASSIKEKLEESIGMGSDNYGKRGK